MLALQLIYNPEVKACNVSCTWNLVLPPSCNLTYCTLKMSLRWRFQKKNHIFFQFTLSKTLEFSCKLYFSRCISSVRADPLMQRSKGALCL